MTGVRVVFFKELDGTVPMLNWLEQLQAKRVRAKCWALIKLLAKMGHDLKRPRADTLREGIRELRTEAGNVNYRILYFFYGNDCVVLSHGITKKDVVPDIEINRAIARKRLFMLDSEKHTFYETEQSNEEK